MFHTHIKIEISTYLQGKHFLRYKISFHYVNCAGYQQYNIYCQQSVNVKKSMYR